MADCESNYRHTLANRGLIAAGEAEVVGGETLTGDGTVAEIRSAVIDGNTHYYVRMEHGVGYLDFSAAQLPRAVLIDEGDHIYYTYRLDGAEFPENGIVPAESFWFEGETPESGTT